MELSITVIRKVEKAKHGQHAIQRLSLRLRQLKIVSIEIKQNSSLNASNLFCK